MKLGLLFPLVLAACASSSEPAPDPPTDAPPVDAGVDETWPTLSECLTYPWLCPDVSAQAYDGPTAGPEPPGNGGTTGPVVK